MAFGARRVQFGPVLLQSRRRFHAYSHNPYHPVKLMSVAEVGVYWPFKSLLQGSGITISETANTITIGTTGAGPGGGDMLISAYATNGQAGVVDQAVLAQGLAPGAVVAHASLADRVPWAGIIGAPTIFPTDWNSIANKPSA